jgi:hypothetical protein
MHILRYDDKEDTGSYTARTRISDEMVPLERKLVNNISRIPELFEILGVSSRQLLIILDSTDLKKALKDEAPHLLLTKSEKLV